MGRKNPIHGAPGDPEEFDDLRTGVLTSVVEGDEALFLRGGELGLLAAEPSLGLGDLHALSGAGTDVVGLEFGDHRQDDEH